MKYWFFELLLVDDGFVRIVFSQTESDTDEVIQTGRDGERARPVFLRANRNYVLCIEFSLHHTKKKIQFAV